MSGYRLRIASVFALSLPLLLLVTAAQAQEGGGGGGGRRGRGGQGGGFGGGFQQVIDKAALLGSDKVREEIKVTADQAKKVDEILAAHRQESMDIMSGARGGRDLSQEERDKKRKESADKMAELRKKTGGKLETALEKAQLARLGEIELQQQGTDGLVAENVAAALKLSKEQVDTIKKAVSTRDEETRKLFGAGGRGGPGGGAGGGGDFEENRKKQEALRKTADDAALATLTKEQKDELEKMKGKPFELDRRSLFRGGPGGGRGGPGGGGGGGRGGRGNGERQRPPPDNEV